MINAVLEPRALGQNFDRIKKGQRVSDIRAATHIQFVSALQPHKISQRTHYYTYASLGIALARERIRALTLLMAQTRRARVMSCARAQSV